MDFDGIIILGLIPIVSLISFGITTKNKKFTLLTFFPNIFLLIIWYILNKFGAHDEPFRTLTSFNLNMFNIIIFIFALAWSLILFFITKKEFDSKKLSIINSILFFILFFAFFIFLKMYYSCH